VQIGANDFVNKVVKDTDRYSVVIEEKHDDVTFILRITGKAYTIVRICISRLIAHKQMSI